MLAFIYGLDRMMMDEGDVEGKKIIKFEISTYFFRTKKRGRPNLRTLRGFDKRTKTVVFT